VSFSARSVNFPTGLLKSSFSREIASSLTQVNISLLPKNRRNHEEKRLEISCKKGLEENSLKKRLEAKFLKKLEILICRFVFSPALVQH